VVAGPLRRDCHREAHSGSPEKQWAPAFAIDERTGDVICANASYSDSADDRGSRIQKAVRGRSANNLQLVSLRIRRSSRVFRIIDYDCVIARTSIFRWMRRSTTVVATPLNVYRLQSRPERGGSACAAFEMTAVDSIAPWGCRAGGAPKAQMIENINAPGRCAHGTWFDRALTAPTRKRFHHRDVGSGCRLCRSRCGPHMARAAQRGRVR